MAISCKPDIPAVIGRIPYRMAFAGGWIDQPFISRLNPEPPGSMVVVGLRPYVFYMDRCGMATSTRAAALRLWNGALPDRDPAELMRELYREGEPGGGGTLRIAGHGRIDLSRR